MADILPFIRVTLCNSGPEGVRLVHHEDGVANVLLGEEFGHVGYEPEELLKTAAVGDNEAELVSKSVEVRVGVLPRQDEGNLVAVVAVVGGPIIVTVADPFDNSALGF